MVTKGLIKSIDYNSNTCKVRLPLFENASQPSEVCVTAIFAIQPGSINGYKENDVVIVAFDGGSVSSPIVIGKLYLGAAKESKESRGAIKCDSLSVASEATLPLTTKLISGNFGTNTIDIDGGASSYTSLLDLVKSLQKTEENFTKSSIDLDAQIAEIVIEYVSVSVDTTVTNDTELTWQPTIPDWRDGYNIWQKTTYLNRRGQILGTPEIVCLSELTTIASYWLKCSTRSHSGSQQNSEITITAMIKLGSNLETDDTDATLEYRWSDGSTKQPEVENPEKPYELKFINTNEAPFPNADLIITAKRNGVEYESETISFMPLNTPILILSNESDWIEYDSYGINKINQNAFVESTAEVMLNNKVLPIQSITWTSNNNECEITQTNTTDSDNRYLSSTVKVSDIVDAVDTTYVTCTAIYVNNLGENNTTTLTKRFSVAKNKAGKSAYEVVIDNDFVSIPATSEGDMADFAWTLTKHKVTALYGDEILACTCSDGDGATTQDVHLKYTLSDGITLANTPSASESKTPREIQVASLSGKTGSITYELFKKGTKVASSKFEIIRVDAGEPSTSYSLICSHSNINKAANGTISPNVILVGVSKKRGEAPITRLTPTADSTPISFGDNLYLKVYKGSTEIKSLKTCGDDYKIPTTEINKYTPIRVELYLKTGDVLIDRETISIVEDGKGGDSIEVQQVFYWTSDYLKKPKVPSGAPTTTKNSLSEIDEETWTYLTDTPTTNNQATDWRLVYLSTRTITTPGEGSTTNGGNPLYSAWTDPEVFLCKEEGAYRVLTTADGLFGYGQGVYYTPAPERTIGADGKTITTNKTITINGTNYTTGAKIPQNIAVDYVAAKPSERKDDLELYIDAEYIRTGAFTVGNASNPLFQAGLDNNNVTIGGFTVNSDKLTAGAGTSTIALQSKSDDTEFKSIYLGNDNPEKAPFSVTNTGKLKATSGKIGGFDISDSSLYSNNMGREVIISPTEIKLGSDNGQSFADLANDQISIEYLLITDTNEQYHTDDLSDYVVESHGYNDNDIPYFIIREKEGDENSQEWHYFEYINDIEFNGKKYSKWAKFDYPNINGEITDGINNGQYSVLTNQISVSSGLFKVTSEGELYANKGKIGGFEISENKLRSIVEQNNYFSISDTYEVTNVQLTNTANITYSNFNLINFPIYITKNDENKTEVLVTGSDEDEDNDSYYVYCSKQSADNASISTFIALERPDFDNDFTIVDGSGNTSTNTGNTLTPPPSWGNTGTNTNKASYCIAKIKFKADISYFRFYIASSAESNCDYMIASTLNAATIPTSDTSSASAYKSTRGKQTAATNGNVDKIDLTADTTIKVEYESIKEGDYVYVVFRKDYSVDTQPDCGWLIMPKEFNADVVEILGQDVSFNSANAHRDRQIWLTPQGSSETIAGEPGSDWGLTVGKDFGVDLKGQLFARGARLKGNICADEGFIGPLSVNKAGINAGGLFITEDKLVLSKPDTDSAITLGIGGELPYIDFSNTGYIYGPGQTCGFFFSNTDTSEARKFKAELARSNNKITVNITVRVTRDDGTTTWAPINSGLVGQDLINAIVLQTETKGVDKDFWGNGTNITETLTFTFTPGGSSSQTKTLSKDFDVFGDTTFVKNDTSSYEFDQKKYGANALTSIGGIIPTETNPGTLGSKNRPWSSLYTKWATSELFYALDEGIVQLSDKREKTNINYDLSKYNSFFDNLKPTSYQFVNSSSERTHLGFIAQELEQSLYQTGMSRKDGALVVIEGDGFDKKTDSVVDEDKVKYGIRYSELHALEIDQIQKLKKRVSDQEQIIKDLETRIKNLETK